jgi:hypothetical protein
MESIPEEWRTVWCGGEYGPCACNGCVPIGNLLIMVGLKVNQIDPERIDESKIDPKIYNKFKVTKEEWQDWMKRNGFGNKL